MEISEHFVHLASSAGNFADTQFLTRELDLLIGGNRILIALDTNSLRHLFIPVGDKDVVDAGDYKSMTIEHRELTYRGRTTSFLDLKCVDPKLGLVFERLIADIVHRLSKTTTGINSTVAKTIEDWRELLEQARLPLSRETILGLVGELAILQRLSEVDPHNSIDCWRGPDSGVHDFVSSSNSAIEVKTTASADGEAVQITSIDQLDESLTSSLHLAVVHVRKDPIAQSLDERIETLLALGVPRSRLLELTAKAGYVYESGSADGEDRYSIRSTRFWVVDSRFPGLRRSSLNAEMLKGVTRVRYELSLAACDDPLNELAVNRLLEGW